MRHLLSALFKTTFILIIVLVLHAVLVWQTLLQPKKTVKPVIPPPVQISFIQLAKPVVKTAAIPNKPKVTKQSPKPQKIRRPVKPQKAKPIKKPIKKIVKTQSRKPTSSKIATAKPSHTEKTTSAVAQHSASSNKTFTQASSLSQTTTHQGNRNDGNVVAKKTTPKPRFNQAYLYQPKPPYTRLLRRLNAQGTVKLRIVFARQGNVKQVTVIKSSGTNRLDNHAVKYVQQHWRYNPPQTNQQWTTVIPIRFYLQ